ncbi:MULTISPECIES: metallophosphoesterase family protein [unclassified Brucella]|uniref:metallophosphoesterase family protein n=1 Tax=unclassified Brucella TaxID=2632610 RepID=UPI00217D8557|nr:MULTISPECIES: metallophosphoesterase family protein [unclassified Brucella]UWF68580.1 serine/threonine protein phosphatase [Brucella sp. 1315]UWF71700.1 serine/threonine protein phosphatase [Brucella sp. 2594]
MKSSKVTYAIGDVHGRADLLEKLLDQIQTDADQRAVEYRIIFLGDIIDRGPDSRRAMDLVHATLNASPDSRLILGNHEEYFLRVLDCNEDSQETAHNWIKHGGYQTLDSYGLVDCWNIQHLAEEFGRRFAQHLEMMRKAESIIIDGNYAFVHAGIEPGVPLADQDEVISRWIRHDFLNHTAAHEKIIVHGHTITASQTPEIYANRIALDTGAYATGVLSAAVINPLNNPQKTSFIFA